MTKDSKLSRISDSASGGKGESMASEIRSTKWTASEPLEYNAHHVTGFIEVSAPNDACFTALFPLRKDAEDYIAWKNSEKGLASRVEELENGLGLASVRLGICIGRMRGCNEHISSLMDLLPELRPQHELIDEVIAWQEEAQGLLAGAHAEEKG